MSSSPFDIDRARRETRGCEQAIHFNNAGSAMTPAPVADYLYAYLRDDEVKGGYETAAARVSELENFYKATARLVNGSPDEVAFIENATRAWDQVFYAFPLSEGDKILTTVSEYGSNLIAYLQRARQCGAEVVIIPNDNYGQIDTNALEAAILQEGGFETLPAGAVRRLAYWRLSGGETAGKVSPVSGDAVALSEAALLGLRSLVTAFDDPRTAYAATPRPGWAPRFNDYAHLARILEWSSG